MVEALFNTSWQDLVFTIGQLVFLVALIPALLSPDKPPAISSFLMGTVLLVFAIAFASLTLWFAAVTVALVGGLWYVLAGQKIRQRKHR